MFPSADAPKMQENPDLRPVNYLARSARLSMLRHHNFAFDPARSLRLVYERLLGRFGCAGWWPGETAFEVCLGAILVQNTAWANVVRALAVLRLAGLLEFEALDRLSAEEIAPLIRASGCFRVKARRVRALLDFLALRYGGRAEAMSRERPLALRRALLEVHGIGRETADSIALYAAGKPLFVVDAYTRRVFSRLGLVSGDEPYDELQRFFMLHLRRDASLYNDFHAQVVNLGKGICRPRPRCSECPLASMCPRRGVSST
jgi:endonuclease-3 related protein